MILKRDKRKNCIEDRPLNTHLQLLAFVDSNVMVTVYIGYYCSGTGLIRESALCTAGYYCPAGETTPTPATYVCPLGFECPTGSPDPLICQRG